MAAGEWPVYAEDEIEAVQKVLRSGRVNYWTGDECRQFENEFASYHGVKHAITLANGTLALELALRVHGIGDGDEVIVTARSYFASASCIALSGAVPVFADVDSDSQNVTAETLLAKISARTRAILIVHLAGWPCDMPEIMELARENDLIVVEDCAQAHGAKINGQLVGTFGHSAAFSFCQDKIMSTAGEGGMFVTNDSELWKTAWAFKDHGKSYDRVHADDHPPGFRWLHESFGSNWRMTEVQAAVGRLQLRKLDDWVAARRNNAALLRERFSELPLLRVPWPDDHIEHSFYKFYAFVHSERLKSGWTRDRLLARFSEEGIPGLSGSCPEIYFEGAFADGDQPRLPVAQELGDNSLMFLVHPTLSENDINQVCDVVARVCGEAYEIA